MAGNDRILGICDELIQAVSGPNPELIAKALQRAASAATISKPEQVNAGVARLLPVIETIQYGPGADLAKLTGAMTDFGTDVRAVLPVLVRRATEAMELAVRMAALYGDASDKAPDPEAPDQCDEAVRWLTADGPARLPEAEAREMAQAWFACGDWVQPVMHLCQRKDVRAALPERERLTAAAAAAGDHIGAARWLHGLLRVLDDAPLVVLHRRSGRGFKVTISGIGDNAQLHILLAANLIGSERRWLLPGKKPSRAEIAAATQSPSVTPRGGITGRFNLVDGHGDWIRHEGHPADIPLFRDERVIVLDPLPRARSWNTGRRYPLMKPEVTLQRHLSEAEAAEWIGSVEPAKSPPVG